MDNIKITGIYDKRTFKVLKDLGVSEFAFDFRPKSFNFLPGYKYIELIKEFFNPNSIYYLRFHNEADYIISKLLEDTKKTGLPGGMNNFVLEFSCNNSFEFYDSFKTNYLRYYGPNINVQDLFSGKYLKGLVLEYSFLERLHQDGTLHNFARNFFSTCFKEIEARNLDLILELDWDSDIIPTLVEYFDFTAYSFQLNSKVEVCYRNIDVDKVKSELFKWSNSFI